MTRLVKRIKIPEFEIKLMLKIVHLRRKRLGERIKLSLLDTKVTVDLMEASLKQILPKVKCGILALKIKLVGSSSHSNIKSPYPAFSVISGFSHNLSQKNL